MSEMITKLSIYFSFPFVRNAMIVGVLIALSAAIFGVVLVLKRFSFIGDGLSHVAFGAMAVATVAGATNSLIIVLPVTVASAVLILKSGENRRIGGDATIAMISVSAYEHIFCLAKRHGRRLRRAFRIYRDTNSLGARRVDMYCAFGSSARCFHHILQQNFLGHL